jgi:mono/diheme cytochrome c family protein
MAAGWLALLLPLVLCAGGKSPAPRNEQIETGRRIFVKRCAGCHNAAGDKPLEAGLPLSERSLNRYDTPNNIAGRLPDATAEELAAVERYVRSINRHEKAAARR